MTNIEFENTRKQLFEQLFNGILSNEDFDHLAFKLFYFQNKYNPTYSKFVDLLIDDPGVLKGLCDIPFLPVQLFKSNRIQCSGLDSEIVFESSGTSGSTPSRHFVHDLSVYRKNSEQCFLENFGQVHDFQWFALLPSYLEKGESSLVHMVDHFIRITDSGEDAFYRYDYERLLRDIQKKGKRGNKKKILIGVSYALLDLARKHQPDLSDVIILETGGMKGRDKEMPREELYTHLKQGLNVDRIYSEYGMTELFSQAYTQEEGIFQLPSTMKILISDINDPKQMLGYGQQGRVNIIDLANIDSCSFLATDDLGVMLDDKHFKILGRTDASEMRGCNLLYTG